MVHITPKRTSIGLLLFAGLALAAWGCQKKEQAAAPAPAAQAPAAAAAPQPAATVPPAASMPVPSAAAAPPAAAPAAAPAPAPASAAVASADGEKSGIRVEVTELKRVSGGTISLKFTFINDSEKKLGFGYDFGDPDHQIKDHGSVGGIMLLDPVGKKKYFVVRDSENTCLCSRGVHDIESKSRGNLWAKFPAPPEDVKKISVVIPHFGPMDDVPISQ